MNYIEDNKKSNNEIVYKTINANKNNILNNINKNINKTNTCLIIVDMLNIFVKKSGDLYHENYKKMIPDINNMISICRDNNLQVIFVRHAYRDMNKPDRLLELFKVENLIDGSKGVEIYNKLDINLEKDYIIKKRRYSAFYGTDLELVLHENNIKNIIVCGVKTNNCIRALVQDAYNLNLNIIIPENCVSSDNELVHQVNLNDMIDFYSVIYLSQDKIKELLTQ